MKTFFKLTLLLLIWNYSNAQFSEITEKKATTPKVVTDSIVVFNQDSLFLSPFKSTGARINVLNTNTIHSAAFTGGAGSFTTLGVLGNSILNTVSASSVVSNTVRVSSQPNANPLFTTSNGSLTKNSPIQFLPLPAVAFFPEQISPYEAPNFSLMRGGIRKFTNMGEVEAQSVNNNDKYALVTPIGIPLVNADANVFFSAETKMCVFDNENRDLVALFYEVNSSENQANLQVIPKFLIRSSGAAPEYRCFNAKKDGIGTEFPFQNLDNSYYVSVFPISSQVSAEDVFSNPNQYLLAWQIDNPALKLVHIIVGYQF
jgi:hypothetical protein